MSDNGWIGVDLDGTLAFYDGWRGPLHIGAPIPGMVARVRQWLAEGRDVRIFTARVSVTTDDRSVASPVEITRAINDWCLYYIGVALPITCTKDFQMIELWDDRCVQIRTNTGKRADGKP